jgi:hypothetical protein
MREGRRCAEFLQETGDRFAPFALFEAIAAQFSPSPLVETLEFEPACRKAVVGQPSHEKQVEFDNHPHQTDAPVPTGNLSDSLFRAVDAFGRDAGFAVQKQPVAEELSFSDRSYSALFTVHPELEFLFQKPGHRFHHALPRRPRAHVDVAVVGIAAEAMAPAFQ